MHSMEGISSHQDMSADALMSVITFVAQLTGVMFLQPQVCNYLPLRLTSAFCVALRSTSVFELGLTVTSVSSLTLEEIYRNRNI